MKPNFKLAYIKANELLVSNKTIVSFPFLVKELVKEKTDIRCRSYSTAKKYGLDINDFGSKSAVLFEYHGKRILFYNDTLPIPHINYSILHELGHFDMEHIISKHISEELYNRQEIETNYYAAQILMPEQLLRYLQQQGHEINALLLKNCFGVSSKAANKRIITISKTNTEWYSIAEKEYDDLILDRYLPLIQSLCPHRSFNYEEETGLQSDHDTRHSCRDI